MSIETKETLLEVLLYLFENYMNRDSKASPVSQEQLAEELEQAGFNSHEVSEALHVLQGLTTLLEASVMECSQREMPAIRIFTSYEIEKLDVMCRGFILFLEHLEILDALTRERVIERTMALEVDEVDLQQLKWVMLMELFSQPSQQMNLSAVVNVASKEASGLVH